MKERQSGNNPAFKRIIAPGTKLEQIAAGFIFTEGPTWRQGALLFSDIPADTIYRWTEETGVSVWRRPSYQANGNTLDREGRLITCEHGSRTLTRTEHDGTRMTIATTFDGKKLNSPNDAVVKSDGTIWFTDPPYGVRPEDVEQRANFVFRLEPGASEPVAVADDFSMPNGLAFSPDEKYLYIGDSDENIHHIRRFRVEEDNSLRGGDVFANIEPGVPDGMRIDGEGRLFASAGDGIQVYNDKGGFLGLISTPEVASNCAFGGEDGRWLFITAVTKVWRIDIS